MQQAPWREAANLKGSIYLAAELREVLGVKPGDYVALTPTDDGVLVTAAEVGIRRQSEAALEELVREMARVLEAEGIIDEEELDEAIAVTKREAFKHHYGRPPS